jgi:rhodanese-related sulfurtransferase
LFSPSPTIVKLLHPKRWSFAGPNDTRRNTVSDVTDIDPSDAVGRIGAGALLLDVREDHEWEAGRAPQAIHIALGDLVDRVSELPVDREVVCVCRAGGRSRRAAEFLRESGFVTVNLAGGMQAWAEGGWPIVADGDDPIIV